MVKIGEILCLEQEEQKQRASLMTVIHPSNIFKYDAYEKTSSRAAVFLCTVLLSHATEFTVLYFVVTVAQLAA